MAEYEHLPIYKKAYDFALYCEKIVRNFNRYHKYTLGTELRDGSRDVIRLCVKVFANFNPFQYAINEVLDISKQNEG